MRRRRNFSVKKSPYWLRGGNISSARRRKEGAYLHVPARSPETRSRRKEQNRSAGLRLPVRPVIGWEGAGSALPSLAGQAERGNAELNSNIFFQHHPYRPGPNACEDGGFPGLHRQASDVGGLRPICCRLDWAKFIQLPSTCGYFWISVRACWLTSIVSSQLSCWRCRDALGVSQPISHFTEAIEM